MFYKLDRKLRLLLMSPEFEIKRRIRERGKITYAEFIEISLYWPHGGYYSSQEPIGSQGDYYTSPVVHPAFGALITVQLFQMWHEMGEPAHFTVVELGAGNGRLCQDIIHYSIEMPNNFASVIRYVCLDRRTPEILAAELPKTFQVLANGLPLKGLEGCILSNEYLDAFPVHQILMTKDGLKEIYIGMEGDELVEITDELSDPRLATRFANLGISLIEGQTAEVNLALDTWAQDVSAALDIGFVLTIDYGHLAQDLYDADIRSRGTLVTYHKHAQTDNPLTMIGSQDITAQVDFTSVKKSGESAGLNTLGLVTQREFLSNLQLATLQHRLSEQNLSPRQMQANQAGISNLIRPGGLGHFKVLLQGKNVGIPELWGIEGSKEVVSLISSLPVPLLTDQHLALPYGRFFEENAAFEAFWPFPESETLR